MVFSGGFCIVPLIIYIKNTYLDILGLLRALYLKGREGSTPLARI